MRQLIIAAMALISTPVLAAEPIPKATAPQVQSGRYVIVFSPFARADTYLIDTLTGKTWSMVRFTDLADDPRGWEPIPQINTPADERAVAIAHPPKPNGASPAVAP